MKSKYLLVGATTLLSAATATFASNAEAQTTAPAGGTFSRTIGIGDISATYDQFGWSSLLFGTGGIGSSNDLWLKTKLFSKQNSLIHVSSLGQSTHPTPDLYYETASVYVAIDGKFVGPSWYTCETWDTCSNVNTGFEQALWNEKKSFGVLPGVSLTVTGSLNTKASLGGTARAYSGPASLGVPNHRIRAHSTLHANLDLSAKLRGELDVLVASVALYGKVKIVNVGTNQTSDGSGDRYLDGSGRGFLNRSASASNTISTGAGDLGFEGKVCLPCILSPLTPIPYFTSFKQKLTSWGNLYSRTGELWNQSF